MIPEPLQELFKHHTDWMDLDTWCRSRVTCKTVNIVIALHSKLKEVLRIQHKASKIAEMERKLDEAAEIAQEIISQEEWSPENRRCCSRNCSNKTGIWVPLRVMLKYAAPDTIEQIESLWWRNNPTVRHDYVTYAPQQEVTTWMKQWMKQHCSSEAHAPSFYVVCSESCLLDVKQALKTIHWRTQRKVRVFLGVEKLVLRSGVIDVIDSD